LIHVAIDFEFVAVRIEKIDAVVTAGSFAAFEANGDIILYQVLAGLKQNVGIFDFYGQVLDMESSIRIGPAKAGARDQTDAVMVRAAAEENHPKIVSIGLDEAHDFGPKLNAAIDIAHLVNEVAKLLPLDGRFAAKGRRIRIGVERHPLFLSSRNFLFHAFSSPWSRPIGHGVFANDPLYSFR